MLSEIVEKIANAARRKILGGKILSVKLSSKHNPHFAKILIQDFQQKQIAVLVELTAQTTEATLSTALIWFRSVQNLKSKKVEKLWLVSDKPSSLEILIYNLKPNWQQVIRVFNKQFEEKFSADFTGTVIEMPLAKLERISSEGRSIVALSPLEIDVNFNCESQIFTFKGLPFAKIEAGKTLFGVENQHQILTENNRSKLLNLIQDLRLYRAENSPNKKHLFHKTATEAWLESILRNDIAQLENNLILSPIYPQFRLFADRIDLLALRNDGRLIIIELKTTAYREMVLQAVDYWQEVEKHRLAGNFNGLFGGLEIADKPTIIYLAAPHSAFHQDFSFFADAIRNDIEIWRFDLCENWREEIKIANKSTTHPTNR
jgi:hypothetical protein